MKERIASVRQGVYRNHRWPFLQVRSTLSSRLPYAGHFHGSLSLGVLFAGETALRRDDGTTVLRAGQMTFIAPMAVHSCNPVGGRARGYHMFYLDAEWVCDVLGGRPGSRLSVDPAVFADPAVFGSLMRLAAAVRGGTDAADGGRALAAAVRQYCRLAPESGETGSALVAQWMAGEDEGEARPTVAGRAREMGVGREGLIRRFRRETGVTPVRYRQCLRLIRAGALLRQGKTLADTAVACGYADQSHFHRMCVKYLSATPAQLKPVEQ